jgi:hypothetical protein
LKRERDTRRRKKQQQKPTRRCCRRVGRGGDCGAAWRSGEAVGDIEQRDDDAGPPGAVGAMQPHQGALGRDIQHPGLGGGGEEGREILGRSTSFQKKEAHYSPSWSWQHINRRDLYLERKGTLVLSQVKSHPYPKSPASKTHENL